MDVLREPGIREALRQAWYDSQPGITGGHEEGGFICRASDDMLVVDRWPRGEKAEISIPPHPGGQRNGERIVATFHTHPNTGNGFYQEPSPGDRRAVGRDPHLKHPEYVGEFVISQEKVYLILPSGDVHTIGSTEEWIL